jgi:putative aminopeptidase FrvX
VYDLKTHLKILSEAHAVSGHEGAVAALLMETWQPWVDAFDRDRLGSLIGVKRGAGQGKIMLAAHMDEIGMIVRDIVDGFLLVGGVAGIDARLQLAQPVVVHGTRPLKGVVAAVPPHLLTSEARNQYPTLDQLVVDVGLPHEEVVQIVRVGTLITPDAPMRELLNGLVCGKAFDDRACVAALSETLRRLQTLQHTWDVYAAATVQEENGLYGALTAAQHIAPDLAIALDVTFAPQNGVPTDSASEIGGGPAIGLGLNFHPKLYERLIETAKRHEIKYQVDVIPTRSGTDAWSIQTALEGIPTALISIPIRNMHSVNETLDLKDVERAGRWLAHFIAELDENTLASLADPTAASTS